MSMNLPDSIMGLIELLNKIPDPVKRKEIQDEYFKIYRQNLNAELEYRKLKGGK